jgi:MFS family permease
MLCDYFKGHARERWLASQTGVASLSALVIIPLGGILGAKFGWQGPFLVYLYSLLLLVFVFLYCWEPAHEPAPQPADAANAAASTDARYQTIPWPRMIGIILITVVGSVMFYSTITQNANALVELGIRDPAEIGKYATFASFGVPIGTVLFWWLGRLQIGLLLFIDFLLTGIGFLWMSSAQDPGTYVLAANVQQLGCGLILPTLLVWATRGLAYEIRGWQGAFGIGLFVSGAALQFMGSIYHHSILTAFGALGRFCLVAAAVAIIGKIVWGRRAMQ